jgi:hypothetical protein
MERNKETLAPLARDATSLGANIARRLLSYPDTATAMEQYLLVEDMSQLMTYVADSPTRTD